MKKLTINNLISGGLITNYYCTSQCRHCLYGCSPSWPKDYISSEQARDNIHSIRKLGCLSVHIGGGEPFLKPDKLLEVLEVADKESMGIDYIETNSSWYQDEKQAGEILQEVKKRKVDTLLLSISPFHTEKIPFAKVRNLIEVCNNIGIQVFPWVQSFIGDISQLDEGEIKGTIILQSVQLLLKYIQRPDLRERLPEIMDLLGRLGEKERLNEYLQVMLEYVFQAAESIDVQDVHSALQKIPQGETIMPTIAEKLRQEGMQEGMQKGVQEGIQQGRQEGKQIALITLMNRKFTISAEEKALINSVQNSAQLDQAMEAMLFAQDKAEVLRLLR